MPKETKTLQNAIASMHAKIARKYFSKATDFVDAAVVTSTIDYGNKIVATADGAREVAIAADHFIECAESHLRKSDANNIRWSF